MSPELAPAILFVHGVGMSPAVFDSVRSACNTPRTAAPLRAPYRTGASTISFESMVDDLASLAALEAPVLVVGVSGGATLALALACRLGTDAAVEEAGVVGVVAHEPLVGPLAAELHAIITARAASLAESREAERAVDFVRDLIGVGTWEQLPGSVRDHALEHADVVRHEVSRFVEFAPTLAELRGIRVPLTVTVGSSSPTARHEAARLLERASAARVQLVPGGHLACWEHPVAFAETIHNVLTSPTEPLLP